MIAKFPVSGSWLAKISDETFARMSKVGNSRRYIEMQHGS